MSDQWMQAFNVSIVVAGALVLLVTWFFLSYWMFRNLSQKNQFAQAPLNVTELAMLLQTIRGLVQEQKTLAADFNRSVDKRVTLMREVIQAFSEERERLASAQAELRQLLAQNRPSAAPGRAVVDGLEEPDTGDFIPAARGSEPGDFIEAWVGADFANIDADEPEEQEPFEPETEEERQQSHEAVRALLGGEPGAPSAGAIHPFPEMQDDGRSRITSMRARAYRFYDAGMTVGQIAQELGIGKGEVRLMLNLRERAE